MLDDHLYLADLKNLRAVQAVRGGMHQGSLGTQVKLVCPPFRLTEGEDYLAIPARDGWPAPTFVRGGSAC